ncbi:MAG: tRNA (adenosine(37)-N6)-threonylcarbamoyltransferase complex transferase subunit TsaD [Candidatus Moranbacteria bacterium]|nr:tRNA (adenosine(37)-N6)-threonylcarbamoyltransferase complex transferase subunit TsaD [Candidatus Moranbacteria bacterium]
MRILSIETSCDDTAAAIIEWTDSKATVLANTVSTQTVHEKWGGVVPNLASREHMKNIVPVIEETLTRSGTKPDTIDFIAVTQGPGLMPALLVGVSAAKTLALIWKKPLIGINHLEGHIYANFIGNNQSPITKNQKDIFPLIALIVSGGHTELVLMRGHFQYEVLGETQDDAAGEAFDKVAKLLGLTYPGGPIVAKRADDFRQRHSEHSEESRNTQVVDTKNEIPRQVRDDTKFTFPRPMLNSDDFNFSFSGLKTAVLYFLKKHTAGMRNEKFIDQVCCEFQEAVVDVLVTKTKKAIELYSPQTLVIAGGVSANVRLREQLQKIIDSLNLEAELPNQDKITFLTPEFAYSLDNAAMIGIAAAFRYEHMSVQQRKELMDTPLTLDPDANLPLQNLKS